MRPRSGQAAGTPEIQSEEEEAESENPRREEQHRPTWSKRNAAMAAAWARAATLSLGPEGPQLQGRPGGSSPSPRGNLRGGWREGVGSRGVGRLARGGHLGRGGLSSGGPSRGAGTPLRPAAVSRAVGIQPPGRGSCGDLELPAPSWGPTASVGRAAAPFPDREARPQRWRVRGRVTPPAAAARAPQPCGHNPRRSAPPPESVGPAQHGRGVPPHSFWPGAPAEKMLPTPLQERLSLPLEKLHSHPSPQPPDSPTQHLHVGGRRPPNFGLS